ncbi:hypothetical protein DNU06_02115 [Putridiphycobacter roseus]|uniref:WbqC family protein n=1 Tax=Putridiphycobacter roseus TaxID=2219161 RepID=A0A2W1N2V7_9FLAO|nr:WbqC family protein [Putridiphycobacter roseus]PZE18647.1 hypothetical protein DNU06_02115 [Putridiphycobacter roseus]
MIPVLPATYLGNTAYFSQLAKHKVVHVLRDETYQKQTFRNRAVILSANGPLSLSIPVVRPFGKKTKTAEVTFSLAENWKLNHWKTLKSAYNRSPYFEFYEDSFKSVFFEAYENLFEFNTALTNYLIGKIGITCQLKPIENNGANIPLTLDFSPKVEIIFKPYPYLQTFTEKYGFVPNLSILDLLFNEGPNTICILEESY